MNITEGAIPISIGTSMAFETIVKPDRPNPLDPNRTIPKTPIPIDKYNTLYINVDTLIRNLLGASDSPYKGTAKDVAMMIDEELGIISELIPDTLTVKLIKTGTVNLRRNLPNHLRQITTEKQKKAYARLTSIRTELVKFYEGSNQSVDLWGTGRLSVERGNAMILTHEPLNLIHRSQFNLLHLLESHTGKVKTENMFHTKYYPMPGINLERIPFQKELLVIFGDKSTFKPMSTAYRKSVVNLSIVRKWTSMTTPSKVDKDMKLLNNEKLPNLYTEIRKKL